MKNLTVDTPVIQKDGKILPLSDSAESVGGLEFRVNEGKPQVRVKGTEEWKDFKGGGSLKSSYYAEYVKGTENAIARDEGIAYLITFMQKTSAILTYDRTSQFLVDAEGNVIATYVGQSADKVSVTVRGANIVITVGSGNSMLAVINEFR